MSEARQQASDVVACLELLVDLAEQIMKGQEPWAEVAVAQLTQYLVDARELLNDAGDEKLLERIKVYGNLSAAYQRLVDELRMRLETE